MKFAFSIKPIQELLLIGGHQLSTLPSIGRMSNHISAITYLPHHTHIPLPLPPPPSLSLGLITRLPSGRQMTRKSLSTGQTTQFDNIPLDYMVPIYLSNYILSLPVEQLSNTQLGASSYALPTSILRHSWPNNRILAIGKLIKRSPLGRPDTPTSNVTPINTPHYKRKKVTLIFPVFHL